MPGASQNLLLDLCEKSLLTGSGDPSVVNDQTGWLCAKQASYLICYLSSPSTTLFLCQHYTILIIKDLDSFKSGGMIPLFLFIVVKILLVVWGFHDIILILEVVFISFVCVFVFFVFR